MNIQNMFRRNLVIVSLCAMVIFLTYCLIHVTTSKLEPGSLAPTILSKSDVNCFTTRSAYADTTIKQSLKDSRKTVTSDIAIEADEAREESATTKRKPNERCEQRLPTVILVGSQKSGTSALRQFASYHPKIAARTKVDEARYFTRHYDSHSLDWYRRLMPCSFSDQITMEKTPGYFYGNVSALRIKQMNEHTRILMIFKDPVEVAISIFAMWKAHKDKRIKDMEFEDVVTVLDNNGKRIVNTDSSIIWYSTFILHAKTWVDIFSKDQVYAIDGSAFEENPREELTLLESFLGLKHFYKDEHFVFSKKKNKYCFFAKPNKIGCLPPGKGRAHPEVSKEVMSLLRNYFKPFNAQIAKLMNRTFIWQ